MTQKYGFVTAMRPCFSAIHKKYEFVQTPHTKYLFVTVMRRFLPSDASLLRSYAGFSAPKQKIWVYTSTTQKTCVCCRHAAAFAVIRRLFTIIRRLFGAKSKKYWFVRTPHRKYGFAIVLQLLLTSYASFSQSCAGLGEGLSSTYSYVLFYVI